MMTFVFRFVFPRTTPATAVAQAPVPQACVMPEPRSHTLIRTSSGFSTCTNSTFVRSGKAGGIPVTGLRLPDDLVHLVHEDNQVRISHRDDGAGVNFSSSLNLQGHLAYGRHSHIYRDLGDLFTLYFQL